MLLLLSFIFIANPQAMQLYGGRMTAARLREVGSVTKEAIEKLHRYAFIPYHGSIK